MGINRNILECKENFIETAEAIVIVGINRNILECKDIFYVQIKHGQQY